MDFEALERLGRLRTTGAISENEFELEKRRILGTSRAAPEETAGWVDPETSIAGSEWNESASKTPRNILLAVIACAVLAGVAFATYKYVLPDTVSPAPEQPSATVKLALRSTVKGVHVAPTTVLPQNPHGADPSCQPYEKEPVGQAAKLVRAKGWHVIAENEVGRLSAVSFVGACAPVEGNVFTPIDGNIGMYDGDQLRAVIYGKGLGFVENTDDPTQLRMTNKTTGETMGRVIVAPHRISIQS